MRGNGQAVRSCCANTSVFANACCIIVVACFICCLSIVTFVDIIRHSSELLYFGKLIQLMISTALQDQAMIVVSHSVPQSRERRCTFFGKTSA